MKIQQLAAQPQLKQVTIDTDFIVKAYGEPLEFWMYDRLDIPVWMRLASLKDDQSQLMGLLRDILRDEEGNLVLKENEMLPIDILQAVVEAVVANLGNFQAQTSPA